MSDYVVVALVPMLPVKNRFSNNLCEVVIENSFCEQVHTYDLNVCVPSSWPFSVLSIQAVMKCCFLLSFVCTDEASQTAVYISYTVVISFDTATELGNMVNNE